MKKSSKLKMIEIPEKKTVPNQYAIESKEKKHTIDPRPRFSVSEEILPAIKEWTTGKKYMMEIEVEQTGSRIEDYGDDKGKLVADFRISGIKVEDKSKDDDADEPEFPEAMRMSKK